MCAFPSRRGLETDRIALETVGVVILRLWGDNARGGP